jgi:hypothetical protein
MPEARRPRRRETCPTVGPVRGLRARWVRLQKTCRTVGPVREFRLGRGAARCGLGKPVRQSDRSGLRPGTRMGRWGATSEDWSDNRTSSEASARDREGLRTRLRQTGPTVGPVRRFRPGTGMASGRGVGKPVQQSDQFEGFGQGWGGPPGATSADWSDSRTSSEVSARDREGLRARRRETCPTVGPVRRLRLGRRLRRVLGKPVRQSDQFGGFGQAQGGPPGEASGNLSDSRTSLEGFG